MKKWMAIMLLIALCPCLAVSSASNMFKQKKIAEFMANRPEPEFPSHRHGHQGAGLGPHH